MTSYEYAQALHAIAEVLTESEPFEMPAYQDKCSNTINFFSDKERFVAAAKAIGGKKRISDELGDYFDVVNQVTETASIIIRANRSTVCRVVKPAQEAVYDCEPLLTAAEEKEVAQP